MQNKFLYFIHYKPFEVLSQFSADGDKETLKNYCKVPLNVYPVGRLDYDSEGLLLLTNDTSINKKLLHPNSKYEKEYWVQVEGIPNKEALTQLQNGLVITVNGKKHTTLPCKAFIINTPDIPDRHKPIRFRASIPTSWLRIIITEGKNRQVRKMTAAIGYPTLRLIRWRINNITLENLQPGDCVPANGKNW
jgi:23S rRNA pseudouridine2457 synthase